MRRQRMRKMRVGEMKRTKRLMKMLTKKRMQMETKRMTTTMKGKMTAQQRTAGM